MRRIELLDRLETGDKFEALKCLARADQYFEVGVSAASNVKKYMLRNIRQALEANQKHPNYPDFTQDIAEAIATAKAELQRLTKDRDRLAALKKKEEARKKRRRVKGRYAKVSPAFKGRGLPMRGGLPT